MNFLWLTGGIVVGVILGAIGAIWILGLKHWRDR